MIVPIISDPKFVPTQGSPDAAAYDLRADLSGEGSSTLLILPGQTRLVKAGIKIAIPSGHVGLVCSRSGLALKHGVFVLNAPGVIDADYRSEVGVILHNSGTSNFKIEHGDRIAQLMFLKTATASFVSVSELDSTVRGEGGFGSTGQK